MASSEKTDVYIELKVLLGNKSVHREDLLQIIVFISCNRLVDIYLIEDLAILSRNMLPSVSVIVVIASDEGDDERR